MIPLWLSLSAALPVNWDPLWVFFGITLILGLLDRVLGLAGVYKLLWHPALVRLCLFACIFAGTSACNACGCGSRCRIGCSNCCGGASGSARTRHW